MIQIIVISREKDRTKRFFTRSKKIASWVTNRIDLETTQGLFKAREDYQIDGEDKRLPITIIKMQYKNVILIDAFGKDIPSNYQITTKIREMLGQFIKIIEDKSQQNGYKTGYHEASSLYGDRL